MTGKTHENKAGIIDDVLRIQNAFGEILEMLDEGKAGQRLTEIGIDESGNPADGPEKENKGHRAHGRDDLVVRER